MTNPGNVNQQSLFDASEWVVATEFQMFHPCFILSDEADRLFETLMHEIPWQQHYLYLYGKKIPFPRLMCWMGQTGVHYGFSGNVFEPTRWHPSVVQLKARLEEHLRTSFNSALLNLYRDGKDSMSWHADDESELGTKPVIASVSLGAERYFTWKPRTGGHTKKLLLPHGSLLVMKGNFQNEYLHALPKSKTITTPRINLTFRYIFR